MNASLDFKSFLCALFLLQCLLEACSAVEEGAACNNGAGYCTLLSKCLAIKTSLHRKPPQLCDTKPLICCPNPIDFGEDIYVQPKDEHKITVTECKKHSEQIFEKCEPEAFIVGGTVAKPKEFPHMALLGLRLNDSNASDWFCGGTLISAKYVITAAHCETKDEYLTNYVRLGEFDYATTTDDAQVQDFYIARFIPHPQYDGSRTYNDIALIRLNGTAILNRYVVPACLPLTDGSEFNEFWAAGWGQTGFSRGQSTQLLKVKLQRFDDAKCKSLLQTNFDLDTGLREGTQICAGSYTDNRDTCGGDSGGPLFVNHPDYACMFLIVGITSTGRGCGSPGVPAIYTRIQKYLDWIENIAFK